jgi:hypothetical protein
LAPIRHAGISAFGAVEKTKQNGCGLASRTSTLRTNLWLKIALSASSLDWVRHQKGPFTEPVRPVDLLTGLANVTPVLLTGTAKRMIRHGERTPSAISLESFST